MLNHKSTEILLYQTDLILVHLKFVMQAKVGVDVTIGHNFIWAV